MLRSLLVLTLLTFFGICAFGQKPAFSWLGDHEEEDIMSAAHRIITSQTGWLNTSRPLTPDDLKGRIILLDFWTYCCINCLHVIPELQKLEKEFGDDLTVIGVHSAKFKNEKETKNIRQAILRYNIHHPVVNDFDFSIWQQFGIRAWPSLVLINPEGKIQAAYSGEGNTEAIRQEILAMQETYRNDYVSGGLPIALEADKAPPSTLSFPGKLAWADDLDGSNALLISDSNHNRILAVNPQNGAIIYEIGSGKAGNRDGSFLEAEFNAPQGVAYKDHVAYVADTLNHTIRKIDFKQKRVSTIAGTGKQGYERRASNDDALSTAMASPWDVAFYPDEHHLAIAMAGTHQLWTLDLAKNNVSILAGNGRESIDDGRYPFNSLSQPSGLSVVDDTLYFVDSETSSLRMLRDGSITTLIGTGLFDFGYKEGTRSTALMQHAIGLYATKDNVYIADTYNHAIRRYDINDAKLYDYAGSTTSGHQSGTLKEATFFEPNDVLKVGEKLYIADTNNHRIRIIEKNRVEDLVIAANVEQEEINYTEQLPNLEKLAAVSTTISPTITLRLHKDWKINEDAPTYLALFDKENLSTPVNVLTRDALADLSAPLSGLKAGKQYLLQGTLYYCKKDNTGSCLIKSIEATLTPAKDGQETVLVPVN